MLFEEKEVKHNKHLNNQNQKAFIVIIININLAFFFCVFHAKVHFLKNTDPKNQIILSLFCRPIDPVFFAVLPVDQKD